MLSFVYTDSYVVQNRHVYHCNNMRQCLLYTSCQALCAPQMLEDKRQAEEGLAMGERSLFRLDAIGMWTKLRPGVRAMLAQLAPLFQMWIFTNGNRSACMTHGTLFGDIPLPH